MAHSLTARNQSLKSELTTKAYNQGLKYDSDCACKMACDVAYYSPF